MNKSGMFLGLGIVGILLLMNQNSMAGTYTDENGVSLILLDDGTCEVSLIGYVGRWEKQGNQIVITTDFGVIHMQIEGRNLIASDGTLLIKQ